MICRIGPIVLGDLVEKPGFPRVLGIETQDDFEQGVVVLRKF